MFLNQLPFTDISGNVEKRKRIDSSHTESCKRRKPAFDVVEYTSIPFQKVSAFEFTNKKVLFAVCEGEKLDGEQKIRITGQDESHVDEVLQQIAYFNNCN